MSGLWLSNIEMCFFINAPAACSTSSLGACRELAPSKQESTTYEPSLVCKLLILGCRLLIPDRLLAHGIRAS